MYAFLSYQTADKHAAGEVKTLLSRIGISAFLAHEDIEVSEEWRVKILKELAKADLFIPLLSGNYYKSIWCVQESGIAAFRDMCTIPLSLDGSIPQGFISHIQSTRVEPGSIRIKSLYPGLAKKNVGFLIDVMIADIGGSGSFRGAEANFAPIIPYLDKATEAQIVQLLKVSAENSQVLHASLCVREYLPPLMKSYGSLLDTKIRKTINEALAQYA